MLQDFNAMLSGVQTTTTMAKAGETIKNDSFAQPVFGTTPSFAPGLNHFDHPRPLNDTVSDVGSHFKGFSGFKVSNPEDVAENGGVSFNANK